MAALNTSTVLSVVGVNATVLAIAFAAVLFYLERRATERSAREAAIRELFELADAVNDLAVRDKAGGWPMPPAKWPQTAEERSDMLQRLTTLGMGAGIAPRTEEEADERAQEFVGKWFWLVTHHPFPTTWAPTPDGTGMAMVDEPVSWADMDALRAWALEFSALVDRLGWLLQRNLANIQQLVALSCQNVGSGRIPGLEEQVAASTLQTFIAVVQQGEPAARSIVGALRRFDRWPALSEWPRFSGLLVAIIGVGAFVTGVIWPLIDHGVSPAIYVFVPVGVYSLGLVTLLGFAVRSALRPEGRQ